MDARYPNEWAVSRGSRFLNVLYGFPFDSSLFNTSDDGMPLIRIRDVISGTTSTTYGGTYQAQYVVHHGDVLIGMDGDFNMAAWKSSDALLNQRVCLVRDSQIALARYLLYALPFKLKTIHDEQDSTTVTHLSAYDLNKLTLNLPPIKEQRAIIMALDESTTRYDVAISTLTSQLDVLRRYRASLIHEAVTKGLDPSVPMKPSGVEWIVDIPEGWATIKIRYISTSRNGLDYTGEDLCSDEDDCAVLVIRAANITEQGSLALKDNVYVNMSIDPKLMVRRGDIAIVRTNGSRRLVGKSALIMDDLRATVGGFMLLCRSPYSRYLYWLLHSNLLGYYMGQFDSSTVSQLPHRVFENMMVPFCPDAHERDAICDYLDSKCLVIDRAIDLKKRQLDVLKRRRQSLIYEYVTGKRRVK